MTLETAESFKVVFDSWNCRTNVSIAACSVLLAAKVGLGMAAGLRIQAVDEQRQEAGHSAEYGDLCHFCHLGE